MTTRSTPWALVLVLLLSLPAATSRRARSWAPIPGSARATASATAGDEPPAAEDGHRCRRLRAGPAGGDGRRGLPGERREIRTAVTSLRDKALAAQKVDDKTKAAENRAAGEAFLDTNGKRDGVQILPSGLQYKVLNEGTAASRALATSWWSTTGARGGRHRVRQHLQAEKGGGHALDQVIPGWREALPLMKESSKWQLVLPPELAYGRGAAGIGPNSTLVFEVELLGFRATATSGGSRSGFRRQPWQWPVPPSTDGRFRANRHKETRRRDVHRMCRPPGARARERFPPLHRHRDRSPGRLRRLGEIGPTVRAPRVRAVQGRTRGRAGRRGRRSPEMNDRPGSILCTAHLHQRDDLAR